MGPIALIDETMPVIVIAPFDRLYEKTVSNMQEVAARGGRIILITDKEGAKHANVDAHSVLIMPDVPELISPLVYALPIPDAGLLHRCLHGDRRGSAA